MVFFWKPSRFWYFLRKQYFYLKPKTTAHKWCSIDGKTPEVTLSTMSCTKSCDLQAHWMTDWYKPFRVVVCWFHVSVNLKLRNSQWAMNSSVVARGKSDFNWNLLEVKSLGNHWRMSTYWINLGEPVLPHWRRTTAQTIKNTIKIKT